MVMKLFCFQLSVGSRVRMVESVSDQMPARVQMAGWVVSVKSVCIIHRVIFKDFVGETSEFTAEWEN